MIVFAITVFLSAFLLFQVQPVVAKQVLPWFGGTTAVWATCLVFFQVVLLAGYLYSHWLVKHLERFHQAMIHGALLFGSLFWLPVIPAETWKPLGLENPALRIEGLLLATVGLPYFLLSTTGPLLQAWYARRYAVEFPYRLYSLSNLASLIGLLAYPFLVEPLVSTRNQAWIWSAGYIGFVALCGAAAAMSVRGGGTERWVSVSEGSAALGQRPGWERYLLWAVLASIPSMMLLTVTNFITQNVASAPFLWVAPLAVYLMSFILCFDRPEWYRRPVFSRLLVVALGCMGFLVWRNEEIANPKLLLVSFLAGLFVICMFGHGELAKRKPHGRYLTNFYLTLAVGGAAGGALVSFVAPQLFRGYYETPISLVLVAAFAWWLFRHATVMKLIYAAATLMTLVISVDYVLRFRTDTVAFQRGFYGSLRVADFPSNRKDETVRIMTHGPIDHGRQFVSASLKRRPTAYYGPNSGVGLVLVQMRHTPVSVGAVGLGTGTIAAYGKPGDSYRFYEVNPQVVELAQRHFTFLANSAAKVEIVVGDGRLSLEREAGARYDVIVVDAFSGDTIPVHLLTLEALGVYLERLRPGGVLVFNITNKSLNLGRVLARAAAALGLEMQVVYDYGEPQEETTWSEWVLLAHERTLLDRPAIAAAAEEPLRAPEQMRPWTDDFSNLLGVLR